jgi:hypothetical protein
MRILGALFVVAVLVACSSEEDAPPTQEELCTETAETKAGCEAGGGFTGATARAGCDTEIRRSDGTRRFVDDRVCGVLTGGEWLCCP